MVERYGFDFRTGSVAVWLAPTRTEVALKLAVPVRASTFASSVRSFRLTPGCAFAVAWAVPLRP